mmetsp:Transcript_20192/g.47390  ORF Transcript_20192/g.47390 Transcript_20192/m.47390 type:complete len:205 (-) Transcript_20192:132-746(-)
MGSGKGGTLKFEQIVAMVEALRTRHKLQRPLVLLHEKYLKAAAASAPECAAYFDSLREAGLLFATPHGANDDHYWLYAALNGEGARKCLVVSNDQMRDHRFDMLAPSCFERWRERHVVGYEVGVYRHGGAAVEGGGDGAGGGTELGAELVERAVRRAAATRVSLHFPPLYSSVVQSDAAGREWFFPSAEKEPEEWLCARASAEE